MVKKIAILGSFLLFFASIGFIYYLVSPFLFPTEVKNTTYEIQIGTLLNEELPGVRDAGTRFKNNHQLKVVAIYHATNADSDNLRAEARLFITKKNSSAVLQEHVVDEYPNIAAVSMELNNMNWGVGTYIAHFERDGIELISKEFELKRYVVL